MKLKYNFVTNQVADKIVAVAVGEDLNNFNGFVKMNDVGAFIFDLLKNDISEEEILAACLKQYPDATEQEARETVAEFIGQLKKEELIEE